MAITIKDVARETNLSTFTISKYINGGSVKEKNRIIIEEAINRLGYEPNVAARALKGQKTFTIGLIMDSLESVYYAKLFGLIEKKMRDRGYSVLLCCHHNDVEKARRAVEFLAEKQVDGMMLIAIQGVEECVRMARDENIPIVLLNQDLSQDADCVMSNVTSGVYEAIEYLIQKGHKRIGMITGVNSQWAECDARDRVRGYRRALEDYNLPFEEELVVNGDFYLMSGYHGMMEMLERDVRPTAMFVCNYDMSVGAIMALRKKGIRIPEDFSFVAFDDLEFSLIMKPELTAVRQQVEKIAEHAVDIIMKRIEGDYAGFPQKIKVRTEFKERNSVKII